MTELPLISVIVPAYNAEKWLAECCESVFLQAYPNIELLIIDDGSVDGTFSLADSLADGKENVRVIHTDNGGVCRARNIGLDAARGEYITFLDADDALTENALELLYRELTANNADIAIGWKRNMSPDGRDLGNAYQPMSGLYTATQGLRLSLEDHPAVHSVWGKLYKRTAIGDIRFVEGKKVHEDSFFVFECLAMQPRVVICDEIVIRYRLSENSASRSGFSDKFLDIIYFAEQKRAVVKERFPEYLALSENVIVKANMALLWNLLNTNDPRYKEIEKKAIKDVLERKQYYRTALGSDARLFWLLTHHLYGFYKLLHTVKRFFKR